MDKTYHPNLLENELGVRWFKNASYFTPHPLGNAYAIVLPPPNITGSLHLGHSHQISIMDMRVRYERMMGKSVLWQGGTDHAGIATQMTVEKQLIAQGKKRESLTREAFLALVKDWQRLSENEIYTQIKRLGASIDFSRNRFTQDEKYQAAVKHAFIELYEQGKIYRGTRLVNWDPQLSTAISDLEVIITEEKSQLYYLRYYLKQSKDFLIVATTRPETLFGDVAVAVHPQDSRYNRFIGQFVCIPIVEREIPVIADTAVDPKFGTGCLKITPAHDFEDYKIGQRHQLPCLNILTPQATLNDFVPLAYRGKDCVLAREEIVQALQVLHQLDKIEPYLAKVPRGERSGAIIQPYLTDQWFMRMQPLAIPVIEAIKTDKVKFIPSRWKNVCLRWLENIEDWCISRQLWWGHRLPVWYDMQGHIFVGKDEIQLREKYHLKEDVKLHQDEDVLDTWFSSALWPFATLGWPFLTEEFKRFYPTQLLVTGFDIIFFWVARMLMLGLHFTQQIPFETVYITGLIRDHLGQKMSKTKGNGIDPLDIIQGITLDQLIEKRTKNLTDKKVTVSIKKITKEQFPTGIEAFGADALRFTYYSLASPTSNIHFDLKRTTGFRNFCNKLWQAVRFVKGQFSEQDIRTLLPKENLSVFDQWILSRLNQTIKDTHIYFKEYRFDMLSQTLYEFVWYEYCDWYLEIFKAIAKHESQTKVDRAKYTLAFVLQNILRLLHPLMPFITEKLWQELTCESFSKTNEALDHVTYPLFDALNTFLVAENTVFWIQKVIKSIRTLRSEWNISPHQIVSLHYHTTQNTTAHQLHTFQWIIEKLSKAAFADGSIVRTAEKKSLFASTVIDDLTIEMPLEKIVDLKAEKQKLNKKIKILMCTIDQYEKRLSNQGFIEKAPATVIDQTKNFLSKEKSQYTALIKQLDMLKSI